MFHSFHGTAFPCREGSTDTVCAIVVAHGGEPQQGYRFLNVRAWHSGMGRSHEGDHVSEIGVMLFEMQRAVGKARLMLDY